MVKKVWNRLVGAKRVFAIVGVVTLIVGLVGVAFDDTYHRGRFSVVAAENVTFKESLDGAALKQAECEYNLERALSAYQQTAAQLEVSLPIGQIGWCVGMAADLIDAKNLPMITAAVTYVNDLPPNEPGTSICAFLVGASASKLRQELYVPVQRTLPGGGAESFIVYLSVGENGKLTPLGHYDVTEQEFVPATP